MGDSLLNCPKEATEVDSIPVSCGFFPCGFICFLNEHMMLKDGTVPTLMCHVEE